MARPKGSGKGQPKTRGSGRKKGTPNKITRELKDMILGALDKAGGESYLVKCAEANPSAFLTLIGKVLPTQVTGRNNGPIEIKAEIKNWLAGIAKSGE